MAKLSLPPAATGIATTLRDATAARAWLAAQAPGQHLRMARALLPELRAIDASDATPAIRFEILEELRGTVIETAEGIEARYARKPLPMLEEENAIFQSAWQLWHALAVAYLRVVPLLPAAQMLPAMHRAAIALREALYCHYLAGVEADPGLLPLLYELLLTAESMRMQRSPVTDPHLRYLGESTVAGDISWAMLLHFCDPYRFSPAQFVVANRALSRWRDLANFQSQPDEDPKAKAIALADWLPADQFVGGGPRWLEVKQVVRKLRKRVESIESGESTEQLKLGRDLTGPAAARLLREIDKQLRQRPKEIGDVIDLPAVEVVFGHPHLFTLLTGKSLQADILSTASSAISHERIALFGFDNAANRIDIAKPLDIPSEKWVIEDAWVLRPAPAGAQVAGPTLVGLKSATPEEAPRLAILFDLRLTVDGWLAGKLRLLPHPAITGLQVLQAPIPGRPAQRVPAFLIPADEKTEQPASICLQTGSGVREGSLLSLEESPVEHLRLREAIERGSNFIRFAYART